MKSRQILYLAVFLVGCIEKPVLPPGDPNNGGLILPDNFDAVVVVDSIGAARHIAIDENGDIYVKLRFTKRKGEGNVALRDTTGDGKADLIKYFGDYEDGGALSNGMEIHNGYLYYSTELAIYRNKLTPEDLVPRSEMEMVLTDDHEHGRHWHITKPMSFDESGNMYVPFGAPSNACQDLINTPAGIPAIAGQDPCPELEHHGGIWKFDASRIGLTQEDGTLFASGIRSVVAMDWNSEDENLYVVMHGRDDLHTLYPNIFTSWQNAVLPAEEILRVIEGTHFGWPYCYYDQIQEKKVLAPEYGGNGNVIGRCAEFDNPVMAFPGHWAPNDLLFYQGDQFPDRYKYGAFIAFHGSTNRVPYPQSGYIVVFVPFVNGLPTGDWEIFADGFSGADVIVNTSDAQYRPMGLAMGPSGSLYITDSRKGKIWRIMYKGNRNKFGEKQLAGMEDRKKLPHVRTPDKIEDNLQKDIQVGGIAIYNTYCRACHQGDGKGASGRFPPLDGAEWVTGDKSRLIEVVLGGLEGPIEVKGEAFNSLMHQHSFLDNEQIAQVLTYIRQSFGNDASMVSSEEVSEVRKTMDSSAL